MRDFLSYLKLWQRCVIFTQFLKSGDNKSFLINNIIYKIFYLSIKANLDFCFFNLCRTLLVLKPSSHLLLTKCHLPFALFSLQYLFIALSIIISAYFSCHKNFFPVAINIFPVTRNYFPVARNIFPVTRNFFPVTRNIFPVTRNIFAATRNVFAVTRNIFPVRQSILPVIRTIFLVREKRFLLKFGSSKVYHIFATNARDLQPKFRLRPEDFVGTWFPGSPWLSRPDAGDHRVEIYLQHNGQDIEESCHISGYLGTSGKVWDQGILHYYPYYIVLTLYCRRQNTCTTPGPGGHSTALLWWLYC